MAPPPQEYPPAAPVGDHLLRTPLHVDPLGMPLSTDMLSGERADDGLYIPVIDRIRAGRRQSGLLFVGDCKMSALDTRSHIAELRRIIHKRQSLSIYVGRRICPVAFLRQYPSDQDIHSCALKRRIAPDLHGLLEAITPLTLSGGQPEALRKVRFLNEVKDTARLIVERQA